MDMLHGPLAGKIVSFALPIAAATAVGSNAALVNLLVSLFMGLSIGGNVTVASLIGRGEKARVHEAVPSP